MKKIIVYFFIVFGIITSNLSSLSKDSNKISTFPLSILKSQAYADGETTIEDCMKQNCIPIGIFCIAQCDGYVVNFPNRMGIPTWP